MIDKKIYKNKKRNIIIIITILIILFIVYGISIKSTPESREKKIISYLEKKYNSKFEIVQLIDSGENVLFDGISCDGSILCPEIKEKGVYYYSYEVLSVSDKVTFNVTYLDKKLKDKITEETSYFSLKNTDNILKDIANYIINTVGGTVEESVNSEFKNCDYIRVKIDKNLKDIYNNNYMKKLKDIKSYIDSKNNSDKDIHIDVYIHYNDNCYFTSTFREIVEDNRTEKERLDPMSTTEELEKMHHYTLEEYLEKCENNG